MAAQIGAPAAAVRAHEELFAYWNRLKRPGRLPARADICPTGFPRLLPGISLLDVSSREPLDFRIRLAGTGLYKLHGREVTGSTLAEVYNGAAAEYWRAELAPVAGGRAAAGVHSLAWRGASHLSILWIRLPLAADGKQVDMILGYDAVVGLGPAASGIRAA